MLTRRPTPRPYDVIALEVLLTLACALQVGLLLSLAVGTWSDRGALGGPVVGVLAIVALALAAGWFLWLVGVSGWLLAGASAVAGIQTAFLLVLGASGEVVGVSPGALLVSVAFAALGVLCGVFLPAPSSRRYRPAPRVRTAAGGTSPSAPRVSPQVARAADRYAKPVIAGAAAVTGAVVRRVSRPSSPPATRTDVAAAEPEPVLQPRAGTPIRTSGSTQAVAPRASTGVAADGPGSARGGRPATGGGTVVTSGAVSGGGSAAARRTTPGAGTTPTKSSATRPPAASRDPGEIARSGRASIDAELAASPRPSGTRPPRGNPVGRAAGTGDVGDPRAVDPTTARRPPSPTDETLPYSTDRGDDR